MSRDDMQKPDQSGDMLDGERHVSQVAGRKVFNRKAGVGVLLAGTVLACGAIVATAGKTSGNHDRETKLAVAPQETYEPAPEMPAPAAPAPALPPDQPTLPTQAHDWNLGLKPHKLLTVFGDSSGGGAGQQQVPSDHTQQSDGDAPMAAQEATERAADRARGRQRDGNDLASRLTPTTLTGVSASLLHHQPYLLTTGTMIPCILQTAMDSSLPGLVTCVVPQDIMGKTGLTLLDRGTRIVGEFKGGVQQGVERMFVVWTRAETPQGVVINLDSPATDPLGRSGMDGEVDTHFWQRFGGALLLTTTQGIVQAGVAQASQSGTAYINTGSTENVIGDALRGSINIPQTIRKDQGELVSILVARDLDFSTVYGLQPVMGNR